MNKIILINILIACFSISNVKLQDDPPFCSTDNIKPVQPEVAIPIFSDYSRYQAALERNEDKLRGSEEFIEYYDGLANVGISAEVFGELNLFTYNYYDIDELLVYYPYSQSCMKYNLSDPDTSFISPFPVVTVNGSEHILSPLNSLIKGPGFKFVYIGKNNVRGIPVNQWQTCSYSKFELKTYNITVSFSDPDQWIPAAVNTDQPLGNVTGFMSIPVEIKIVTQADGTLEISNIVYTITDFRPFIDLEIEEYTTPDGVYCNGRKSLRELPDLPHSFSFEAQVIDEFEFDPERGLVSQLYEEYNYKYQLFAYAYDKNDSYTAEIHDFNTGLKYVFNQFTNGCEIKKINAMEDGIDTFTIGNDVKLKDPSMFFSFDKDTFQFVGFKRRDGVETEVYIGPKTVLGFTTYYQWHFLADGWNRTDEPTTYKIPVMLKVFFDVPVPNTTYTVQHTTTYHIFNFKPEQVYLNQFDLSRCNSELKKEYFTFQLQQDADLTSHIRKNMKPFKQAVTEVLVLRARVTPLRIGHVEVFTQGDVCFVLFTLYEKSSYYGDVYPPKNDELSANAIKYLREAFVQDRIQIKFVVAEDQSEFLVPVDKQSLTKIDDYEIVYKNAKKGYSATSIGVGVAVVLIAGIALGIVITILEKNKTIQLLKPFY